MYIICLLHDRSATKQSFLSFQAIIFHSCFSQSQVIRSQSSRLASFLLYIFCCDVNLFYGLEMDSPISTTSATNIFPIAPKIEAKSSLTGCSNRSRLSCLVSVCNVGIQYHSTYFGHRCFWYTCDYECVIPLRLLGITHFPQIAMISIYPNNYKCRRAMEMNSLSLFSPPSIPLLEFIASTTQQSLSLYTALFPLPFPLSFTFLLIILVLTRLIISPDSTSL